MNLFKCHVILILYLIIGLQHLIVRVFTCWTKWHYFRLSDVDDWRLFQKTIKFFTILVSFITFIRIYFKCYFYRFFIRILIFLLFNLFILIKLYNLFNIILIIIFLLIIFLNNNFYNSSMIPSIIIILTINDITLFEIDSPLEICWFRFILSNFYRFIVINIYCNSFIFNII